MQNSPKIKRLVDSFKQRVAAGLRQGISPRRLALTIALGFAFGCIPVVGLPTVLCVVAALTLRLNFPALEIANYTAMPLQLALMVPFVRFGCWLLPSSPNKVLKVGALLHASPLTMVLQMGALAGRGMLGWLVIAGPVVALMTATLTALLRRVPALAQAEAGD